MCMHFARNGHDASTAKCWERYQDIGDGCTLLPNRSDRGGGVATTLVWLARKRKHEDALALDTVLEKRSNLLATDLNQMWEQTRPSSVRLDRNPCSILADVSNCDWDTLLMADWFPLEYNIV